MSDDEQLQQSWVEALETAGRVAAGTPNAAAVYQAFGLAWQTSRAVTMPASPATELRWMRLCESLLDAWHGLTNVADPPALTPSTSAAPDAVPTRGLADTPALRAAVAELVTTAAGVTRRLAARLNPGGDLDAFVDVAAGRWVVWRL